MKFRFFHQASGSVQFMRFFGGKNRSGLVLLDFSVKKKKTEKKSQNNKKYFYTPWKLFVTVKQRCLWNEEHNHHTAPTCREDTMLRASCTSFSSDSLRDFSHSDSGTDRDDSAAHRDTKESITTSPKMAIRRFLLNVPPLHSGCWLLDVLHGFSEVRGLGELRLRKHRENLVKHPHFLELWSNTLTFSGWGLHVRVWLRGLKARTRLQSAWRVLNSRGGATLLMFWTKTSTLLSPPSPDLGPHL